MGFLKRLFKKREDKAVEPIEQEEPKKDLEKDDIRPNVKKQSLEDIEKKVKRLENADRDEKTSGKPLYHIKKHDKGWQIIADDAERAWRVFPSQKEAIAFAKEQGLEYLLYRVDGTLRK